MEEALKQAGITGMGPPNDHPALPAVPFGFHEDRVWDPNGGSTDSLQARWQLHPFSLVGAGHLSLRLEIELPNYG